MTMSLFRRKAKAPTPEVRTTVHREIEIILQREWVAPPEHRSSAPVGPETPRSATSLKPE
jgi:hypothetical protein